MSKLYNCVNCQKVLKNAPFLVLEDGEFEGLVLCSMRCMAEHAIYEAEREEVEETRND